MTAPSTGVVQVWCASLLDDRAIPPDLHRCLPASEINRASRFRTGELQRRFIVSRLVLRRILGGCLDQNPASLLFDSVGHGKPVLAGPSPIHFNLSHSGDLMVLAVTQGYPVGVDIERVRALRDAHGLSRRFFSPREADWVQRVEADRVPAVFFRLWTRKEAVLKATGGGLSGGLGKVEVLDSADQFKPVVQEGGSTSSTWHMTALEPAEGFIGALATSACVASPTLSLATFPVGPRAG